MNKLVLQTLPPRANVQLRQDRFGRNADLHDWYAEVALAVREQGFRPFSGPARVEVVISDTRADIDARIKALQDSLERAGCISNDRTVCDLHLIKVPGKLIEPAVLVKWGEAVPWSRSEVCNWWGADVPAPTKG